MTAEAGVLAGSRAVLIGVSAYEYADFPPIRAARNSLQAMRELLSDPALCGWPPESVTVIPNPISAGDLAERIADLAEAATGVLLLYYVGHGVLSARGELCLTVTSTRPDRPKISGLPWDTVAEVLRNGPARTRLAILDCCFSGQAVEALTGDGEPGLADIAHVEGVYTLTATTRNRAAHVPPPGHQDTACTSFTGELRDLIEDGIPGKAARLTFGDIYPVLQQRLRGKGLPVPSQRGTDAVREFFFTANAAVPGGPSGEGPSAGGPPGEGPPGGGPYAEGASGEGPPGERPTGGGDSAGADFAGTGGRPGAGALSGAGGRPGAVAGGDPGAVAGGDPGAVAPVTPGPSRRDTIVSDALRAAHSISDGTAKARALAAVATALAVSDPARGGRLIVDADRVAQAIAGEGQRAVALAAVAGPLAVVDADRAQRGAESITEPGLRAQALAAAAGAVAEADPDRAGRLIAEAEQLAGSVGEPPAKAAALAAVAEGLGAIDTDRAERAAQSVTEPGPRAVALASLARAVAAEDPDRAARLAADAERAAQSTSSASFRAPALAAAARALAGADPVRAARLIDDAERAAHTIPDPNGRGGALVAVVEGLAATDADRAERLAQTITTAGFRAMALAAVAKALAGAG